MTVEPEDRGSFVAVGCENGDTTIVELSHHLIELQRNEKNIFLAVRRLRLTYTDSVHVQYNTSQYTRSPEAPAAAADIHLHVPPRPASAQR